VKAANQEQNPLKEMSWETEQFQRHRPHLQAVAYRMLGSVSEADDALQEAWLRLSRSQQQTINNARAWLTTIVGRVCIDMLRARQARREDYVGDWFPEPIVEVDQQADPEHQVLMADTVGLALLVVLETLTPAERVAYVLHDMFSLPFAEVGEIIDRSPEAARQLASRARRRVRGTVPQPDADITSQRAVVDAFLAASRAGDFDALIAVLHPDVVMRASSGGEPQQELNGEADVARSVATSGPRFASLCHPAIVNGQAGLVIKTRQGQVGAIGFTVTGGLITTIDATIDLDKLEGLVRAEASQAEAPDGQGTASQASLLGYFRARQGSIAERIISEVLSWPGVSRAKGPSGSIVFCVGGRELGHLHGDAVADVPLPPELQRWQERGWASVPLETQEDATQALKLLRGNYERAMADTDVDA
jgi:RNA polymerase sigma-70 factor (ECF subfamily)